MIWDIAKKIADGLHERSKTETNGVAGKFHLMAKLKASESGLSITALTEENFIPE